jgi:hypothetical protein
MLVIIVKQLEDPDKALEFLAKAEPKLKGNDVALALCWLTKGEVALEKKKDILLTKVTSQYKNVFNLT